VIFHEHDPDLKVVKFKLPPCPDIRTIHGYGLPPKEQKWERFPLPKKLEELDNQNLTLTEYPKFLAKHRKEYREEIKYIKKQWDRRVNGFWLFINGKPTYIDGWHYFFLNCWEIDSDVGDSDLPQYRSRDRKFFISARGCAQDPDTFGFNDPKPRRVGDTSKASCINYEISSRKYQWVRNSTGALVGKMKRKIKCGIQSKTEDSAEDVFQNHVVVGWKSLPFFFKPIFSGKTSPKAELRYETPTTNISKTEIRSERNDDLGGYLDFTSSEEKAYDGTKKHYIHGDEVGKSKNVDVYARWLVHKKCLSTGNTKNINGFCINTSTVADMEEGGQVFKQMCEQSLHNERPTNNRTPSGLITLFMPANDCLEGFIDEFGESMTKEATEQIMGTRKAFEIAEEYEKFANDIREAPLTYRECWESSAKGTNFNSIILLYRTREFKLGNPNLVRGNFERPGGDDDGFVVWQPTGEPVVMPRGVKPQGKFLGSYFFDHPDDSNQFIYEGGIKYPANTTQFIAGADPFRFNETEPGNTKSDGAGAVFRMFNSAIDNPGGWEDPEIRAGWKTRRFSCTYSHRPKSKKIYGEDMLAMCQYYGCLINSEINVEFIWEYFEERGYGGYLFRNVDKKTGKNKKIPGTYASPAVVEEIFREWQNYIQYDGMREYHTELFDQCLMIEEKMGKFDLFAAAGYALTAAKKPPPPIERPLNLDDYIESYDIEDY